MGEISAWGLRETPGQLWSGARAEGEELLPSEPFGLVQAPLCVLSWFCLSSSLTAREGWQETPKGLPSLPTVSPPPPLGGCTCLPVPNLDLRVLPLPDPIPEGFTATALPEHSSAER